MVMMQQQQQQVYGVHGTAGYEQMSAVSQTEPAANAESSLRHKDIAREFLRQYYMYICGVPARHSELFRFYSTESTVMHEWLFGARNHVEHGQESIRHRLSDVSLPECQVKIHSFQVVESVNKSLHILAQGGLVVVADGMERPFSQSILLMPQGPKKYYAHSDIFQFEPPSVTMISAKQPDVTFGQVMETRPPPTKQHGKRQSPPPEEPLQATTETPPVVAEKPETYEKVVVTEVVVQTVTEPPPVLLAQPAPVTMWSEPCDEVRVDEGKPVSWAARVKAKPVVPAAPIPVNVPNDPVQRSTSPDNETATTIPAPDTTNHGTRAKDGSLTSVQDFFIRFTKAPEGLNAQRFVELMKLDLNVDLSCVCTADNAPIGNKLNVRVKQNQGGHFGDMAYVFLDLTTKPQLAAQVAAVAKSNANNQHYLTFASVKNSASIQYNVPTRHPQTGARGARPPRTVVRPANRGGRGGGASYRPNADIN